MAQTQTKFIADGAVLSGTLAAHGKIGSGAATATSALFSDGSGGTMFRILASGDIPDNAANTTGTAANITATSNATLTTLSALTTAGSLAISGSQVSGGIFGAVNGSALTNLDAANLSGVLPVGVTGGSGLSIATSQLTGSVSLTSQVSGILPTANGGTGQSTAAASFAALSPLTTAGDIIYENNTPVPAALAIGSPGQVLTVVSGLPAWAAVGVAALTDNHIFVGNASNIATDVAMSGEASIVASGAVTLSNAAVIAKVLTGYVSGAGTVSATDSILSAIEKLNGNADAISASAITSLTGDVTASGPGAAAATLATVNTDVGSFTNANITVNAKGLITAASNGTAGTVTSVAFADASTTPIYSISGSPVTSSGTLTQTLTTQSANTVFAGPTTGSAAQPTFRSLVSADIPDLSATYVTQSEVGAASGVASLDGGGKVPYSQLPSALMTYKGAWDPTDVVNTLTALEPTPNNGDVYRASADGIAVTGNGAVTGAQFYAGDFAIYNGTAWQRSPLADGVVSLNSATGAVVMSMVSANGFAGTYSGTALTVSTTITGILKGDGTAISAATAGTDYVIPSGNITGTAGNVTGTVAIANGGTGQTSAAAAYNALSPMTTTGDIEYESGTNTAARLPIGSSGNVLTVVGGVPAWAPTASALTVTEDIITLSGTDITNQYVDLLHAAQGSSASVNSISLTVVGGPEQQKTVDYTVALTGGAGGVTRITFTGDLATGGNAALAAADILMIKYAY